MINETLDLNGSMFFQDYVLREANSVLIDASSSYVFRLIMFIFLIELLDYISYKKEPLVWFLKMLRMSLIVMILSVLTADITYVFVSAVLMCFNMIMFIKSCLKSDWITEFTNILEKFKET